MSHELAAERGFANGDVIVISTARGAIQARALVTSRMPSLDVQGRRVHQVGLPYHWGGRGLVKGDVVNDLLAISEEPNVRIFESKALTCNVQRASGTRHGAKDVSASAVVDRAPGGEGA